MYTYKIATNHNDYVVEADSLKVAIATVEPDFLNDEVVVYCHRSPLTA